MPSNDNNDPYDDDDEQIWGSKQPSVKAKKSHTKNKSSKASSRRVNHNALDRKDDVMAGLGYMDQNKD